MAIGAATATRGGGCHLRSRFTMEEMDLPPEATKKIIGRPVTSDPDSYEGKAYPAIWMEKLCAVGDALGVCRFVTKWLSPGLLGFNELAEAVSIVSVNGKIERKLSTAIRDGDELFFFTPLGGG